MRYSYLFYSLFFVLLLATILLLRRDLVKDSIPAFLFGAVAGPASELLYLSDYWRPSSIFSIGIVRLEDVLFGMAIFGLALAVYPFVLHKRLGPITSGNDRHTRTFGTIVLAGIFMLVFMGGLHINSVLATALTFTLLWLMICVKRRDLFVPGLTSGLLFGLLAVLVYSVFLNVLISDDQLQSTWFLYNTKLGVTFFGNVPLTEVLWFFGVGCFLSIFELFVNKRRYAPLTSSGGPTSHIQ